MPYAPRGWPASDRARRDALARGDALDPRRWQYRGHRPASHATLWLLTRIEHARGPCIALGEAQWARIGTVAEGATEPVSSMRTTSPW